MAIRSFILIGLIVSASDTSAGAQFTPGHIFVSDPAGKFCSGPPRPWDRIWEIDPDTGQVSLFAELADEWCGLVSGLAFTPDGTKLRVAQYFNRILELDAAGNPTILLDGTDGINAPFGPNCITFDRQGDFYVSVFGRILRFAPGSDIGEVYADEQSEPILGGSPGPITVDLSGSLYFGTVSQQLSRLFQFQGPHMGTVFDTYNNVVPKSLVADSCGSIFLGLAYGGGESNPQIVRYSSGDAGSKVVLADGTMGIGAEPTIALDPTESFLYVLAVGRTVGTLSTAGGMLTTIAELPQARDIVGIAVVPVLAPPDGIAPCLQPIPTLSTWGLAVLVLLLLIAAKLAVTGMSRNA